MAGAQLAITEMMSSRLSLADFFELTNFGTNSVELAGYLFKDGDHNDRDREVLVPENESVSLGAGESIIFVRTNLLGLAEFREFWGTCLGSNVQVRTFVRPGFSSYGDSLTIYDSQRKLVDAVEFDRAERPVSFTYNPRTGVFGSHSTLEEGACYSIVSNNVASPGATTGIIPLQILRHPASIIGCTELDATFVAEAVGMPPPRFQWLFNGRPIAGAEEASLVVSNLSAGSEGEYSVAVSNGLSNIVSAAARLQLDTNAAPPAVVSPPWDVTVVEGRTARFAVEVCAYPRASYQWFVNGQSLEGETNRILFVRYCTKEMSGNSYGVRASNVFGTTNLAATLYVTNSSPLRITEIQAAPLSGCDGHNDWFEITNYGQTDVPLLGYRVSDQFRLADAVVIKRPVILRAGESAIFVKNSSIGSFIEWWGPDQLPPGLQVIPYSGFSLSAEGDSLYLWTQTAEDANEYLDAVSFIEVSAGRTVNFESDGQPDDTVRGKVGVIEAMQCGDLGTPGFTANSAPEFVRIERLGSAILVSWRVRGPGRYLIQYSDQLASEWTTLSAVSPTASLVTTQDDDRGNRGSRFRYYRISFQR